MSRVIRKKINVAFLALQVVALVLFIIYPVNATSLDSSNYRVVDYDLNFGGARSTSTEYTMTGDIELFITAVSSTLEEEGGGGEEPGGGGEPTVPPDTTPPVISGVSAINITITGATIIWSTNEASDSLTDYGVTIAYGLSVSSSTLVTSHSLNLINLLPQTTYHFRVKSKDASSNEAVSADYTFTTLTEPDTTPPIISNIRVENITGTSATVLWDTNESSTSRVDYGETISYGKTITSSTLVKSHQMQLSNLTPDTLYHFRVASTDSSNNTALSSDRTFRTLDTIPPVISNIQVINVTDNSATITWVTNEATTSRIFYRRQGTTTYSILVDDNLLVSHNNTLNNLIANVVYEFYIVAQDASGNTAQSTVRTFRTLPDTVPPANIQNFTATPDDSLNVLTWRNPTNPDYAGVYIVALTETYPRNIREGRIVYVGPGVSFTDTELINGTTYYYSGFAYDTSLNYASGAITKGTPFSLEEEIPVEEEEEIPEVEIPSINLGAVSFFVAQRTIQIYSDSNDTIETLVGTTLSVSVDQLNVPAEVELITLRLSNSNYLLKLRNDGTAYDADILLPGIPGTYQGEITFVFANGQQIVLFGVSIKEKGMIFETTNQGVAPLAGVNVTLYELQNNSWIIWPGSNYFQSNPMVTLSDGSYGFLVPNGTYYLKMSKDGYRDNITARFNVTKNYVNQSLELLIKPKKLEDVVTPGAPLTENVIAVTRNIAEKTDYTRKIVQEEIIQFAQNPAVEKANSGLAAPTLVSVAVINAATAIPFLNLWTYLQYLLTQPLLFFKRRKRKGWGIVYNAFTKLPIDLAIIRLIETKTKRILRTIVTDRQGRYVLFSPKGIFKMTSTKSGFKFPSVYLKGKKEDEAFIDLYYGEQFNVKQVGQAITYNFPMDPVDEKVSVRKFILKRAFKGLQFGLSLSGIVLTTVSFIISPNVKIGLFLILHIALFALFLRLARPAKFKKWGIVRDAETGKPIRNAIVRLFEPEYNKLLGTQITDGKGRYAFLVGRNIYYLTFEKAGYKNLKTKNVDTRTKARSGIITEKVKMEKDKNLGSKNKRKTKK